MKATLIQGTLALALLSHSVDSRVVIQSDNIGETMDGAGILTINNLDPYVNAKTAMPGVQMVWA